MNPQKVHSLAKLAIHVVKTHPPGLVINVTGEVGTPAWTGFALSHYVYTHPPADGIYEADMVGVPPSGPAPQVMTPFEHDETWIGFPEEDLKGLKVYSATSDLTCMLE